LDLTFYPNLSEIHTFKVIADIARTGDIKGWGFVYDSNAPNHKKRRIVIMNFENLRNQYQSLLEFMTTAGYSPHYIRAVRQTIERILSSPQRCKTYEELLERYEKAELSKSVLARKKAILNIIASFDCNGIFPGTQPRAGYFKNFSAYDYLNAEYKSIIDCYRLGVTASTKKESSIRTECYDASGFLLYCQRRGCATLAEMTEEDVLTFFTDDSGHTAKSSTYAFSIATVLKELAYSKEECQRISQYIPTIRRHRKNIQFLTADERDKVKNALKGTENSLSRRNRAIGHLFYFAGIRCSDIANLKLSDIDLELDKISIKEQFKNNLNNSRYYAPKIQYG
jgi:integrase